MKNDRSSAMAFGRADVDRSAKALLDFLERNSREELFAFPFSYSFPKNACESTSLILTYLLEEKYQLDDVAIIKGSKVSGYDNHFWVVAGGLTYDLTAHQFPGLKPVIGSLPDPMHHAYDEWSVEHRREFVDRDEVVELYRAGVIPF